LCFSSYLLVVLNLFNWPTWRLPRWCGAREVLPHARIINALAVLQVRRRKKLQALIALA